jgi:uncharacterized cupin superfamily protein
VKHLAHWNDVEPVRRESGHLAGAWRDLGGAAGTWSVGLQRIEIDPGKWSTPAHVEGAEEEIFYVLGGSGISWQDGEVYEVAEGDCLVHLPEEKTHTLRAGAAGLDVLAFGERKLHGNTVLPRAGVAWMHPSWVEVGGPHPWEREAAAGEPEVGDVSERPKRIVHVDDADYVEVRACVDRDLGRSAGSESTGLCYVTVAPGKEGAPFHCHSAEEEVFVILEGGGTVYLGEEQEAVRPGHVLGRPPGTGIAHSFRARDEGMTYLAYGTRDTNDIAYYPRSNKINFRGIKLIGRIERLDYWEGEPTPD